MEYTQKINIDKGCSDDYIEEILELNRCYGNQ